MFFNNNANQELNCILMHIANDVKHYYLNTKTHKGILFRILLKKKRC